MKTRIFFVLFLISAHFSFADTHLVSYHLEKTYTFEQLHNTWKTMHIPQFLLPIKYEIDVYEIIYNTTWHDGSIIKASGLYFVPKNVKGKAATICYFHGTESKKERPIKMSGEQIIPIGFCTDGYSVAFPDYLGLGKGEKMHLYQHAESEATAGVDMLRATKELDKKINNSTGEQLFITGYSQGGHAAMAAHKYITEHGDVRKEFPVTASSPMSGAYNMTSKEQSEYMFQKYDYPGYLPYLLISYDEIYDIIPGSIYSIFNAPYDTLLPRLFNGNYSFSEMNKYLPSVPASIVKDSIVQAYKRDENYPFKKKLAENSVYAWKADEPVQLCYCKSDKQVDWHSTLLASQNMIKLGSKKVIMQTGGNKYGHNTCALFSFLHTKLWFDSFRKGSKKGNRGSIFKRMAINIGQIFTKNDDRRPE